jgi:hypothetical protein
MLPAVALGRAAAAQERVKSGTVEIEQVQVAFIGSGNVGGGTLHFPGKPSPWRAAPSSRPARSRSW